MDGWYNNSMKKKISRKPVTTRKAFFTLLNASISARSKRRVRKDLDNTALALNHLDLIFGNFPRIYGVVLLTAY